MTGLEVALIAWLTMVPSGWTCAIVDTEFAVRVNCLLLVNSKKAPKPKIFKKRRTYYTLNAYGVRIKDVRIKDKHSSDEYDADNRYQCDALLDVQDKASTLSSDRRDLYDRELMVCSFMVPNIKQKYPSVCDVVRVAYRVLLFTNSGVCSTHTSIKRED